MCAALAEPDLERYPIRLPVGVIRRDQQCFVIEMLDTVLAQASR